MTEENPRFVFQKGYNDDNNVFALPEAAWEVSIPNVEGAYRVQYPKLSWYQRFCFRLLGWKVTKVKKVKKP